MPYTVNDYVTFESTGTREFVLLTIRCNDIEADDMRILMTHDEANGLVTKLQASIR